MGATFLQGFGQSLLGGMGGGQMGGMGGSSQPMGGPGAMAPVSGGSQPMGGMGAPPQVPHMGMQPTPPPRPPGLGNPAQSPTPPPRPPGMGTPTPPMPPVRPTGMGQLAAPKPPASPASPPPAPASTPPVTPTPAPTADTGAFKSKLPGNMGAVETTLRQGGMSPNAVAGIMGNIQQESNFSLGASGDKSIPGGSHGLAQWNRERLFDERHFAAKAGSDDAVTQAKFMLDEADRRSPGLKAKMNAAKSPSEAAAIWMNIYESPAAKYANLAGRQKYAENFAVGKVGKAGLMSRGGGGGASSPSSGGGGGSFKMPDSKLGDVTAATGPSVSTTGQQAADEKKKQEQGQGKGATGKIDVPEAKNYVEVPQAGKPVENILAGQYKSFQEAVASKKATFKDLMEQA